jgi:hypothetical protein
MSAEVIDWCAQRRARGLPEPITIRSRYEMLIDASMMFNPFAMMWLESYGHARPSAAEPTVIHSYEDPA